MDLFKVIQEVTSWGTAEGQPADLFDRLTYRVTSFVMMILVAIIGLKSYVFKPIQCTLSESFGSAPPGFEQYAENMCWIENLFRLSRTEVVVTHQGRDSEPPFQRVDYDMQNKIRMRY